MTSTEKKLNDTLYTVPAFSYELFREFLLPDLLGKETDMILYWAGKNLARKFPLQTYDQIADFFMRAAWGSLNLKEETKNELEFELSNDYIAAKMKEKPDYSFKLEAGFLAQQIEMQKNLICEAFEHPRKRAGIVRFTVKWDKKDHVE